MKDANEKEIRDIILQQCSGIDGFLVKLHSFHEFDEYQYLVLYGALQKYAAIIAEREEVHRAIAGCLLALTQELLIQQEHVYGSLKGKEQIIQRAFTETTILIDQIIPTSL